MVLYPTVALESAQKGVALWASAVLPALLPFFICSNFMILLGIPGLVGRYFERLFQFIFGAPGSSAFVFIISTTSGYPMGPKLIGDMCRRGEINLNEAKRMLTFCSTSGPLFMLGAVGVGMFHSPLSGAVIAVAHYSGAVLNGILYHILDLGINRKSVQRRRYAGQRPAVNIRERAGSSHSLFEMFTESILSALKTLGIICCYLVIFTMATDFLELSGALNFCITDYQKSFLKGLLEMTVGCNALSITDGTGLMMKCVLASFLISFGGFSVFAQSMSVLYGLKISPGYYLTAKLSHGLISGIVAFFAGPFILNKSISAVGAFGSGSIGFELGFLAQLLFSARMIIIILILFMITAWLDCLFSRKEKAQQ